MGQFVTYAQNNEDVILNSYFRDVENGTYVDVGANHPINDSVTKHFYKKGWRGINIEPIKQQYDLLRQDRPDDINVRVGISDKHGTLKLREYTNDGLSTFSIELQKQYAKEPQEKTATHKDVTVPVLTLEELFQKHPLEHIHFMKIDVEGFEYEVLLGNNWEKYRPEMLCIESNHDIPGKDWRKILDKHKYVKVWNDGLNDYYLAEEHIDRRGNFSYAHTMLLSDQVLPHHVVARVEQFRKQLSDEQLKLEVQKIRVKQLEFDKDRLHDKIADQQRIRSVIRLFFEAIDHIIMARLELLHVARPNRDLRPNSAVASYDMSSKEKLLQTIHTADLSAYYSFRRRRVQQKFYLYRALMGSYTFIRRILGKCGAVFGRLLRRGTHA